MLLKNKKNYGFTLVEIIVTITILIILGTIALISYKSYSVGARDGTRITDMTNVSKGLLLYQSKAGKFPYPESYSTLTASGVNIRFQGIAGAGTLKVAGMGGIAQGSGRDPLSGKYYTLITDGSLKQYNLIGFLEKGDGITFINSINKANAVNNEGKIKKILGNDLGIIIDNDVPIHEKFVYGISIDILHTNNVFTIKFFSGDEVTGTGRVLFSAYYNRDKFLLQDKDIAKWDYSLVGYWDMVTTTTSGSLVVLKDFSKNNNKGVCYNGNTIISCGSQNGPYIQDGVMHFDGINDFVQVNKNIYSNIMTTTIRVKPIILDGSWHGFFGYQSPLQETVPPYNNPSSLRPFNLRLAPDNLTLNGGFHYDSHDITATSLSNAHLTGRRCQDNKEYVYDENNRGNMSYYIGYRRNPPYVNLDINGHSFVRRDCRIRSATDPVTPQINTFNTFHTNFNYLRIGRVDNYFKGAIDEVRIYNRYLTDMEISTIYESLNIEDKIGIN